MCQYKSAIAVKDNREKSGFRLLWSPFTESHEELVRIFKLRDVRDHLARVEFSPPDLKTAHQVKTYKLKIDEARTPEWLTDERQAVIVEKLSTYVESIIIDGDADLLIGGQFILAPGARVAVLGQASVVTVMLGTSQVGTMRETSQVGTMWETSQVGTMRGPSQVGTMWETSQVGNKSTTVKIKNDQRQKETEK